MQNLSSTLVVFGIVYCARSIQWTAERILVARIIYAVVQMFTLAAIYKIWVAIYKRSDATKIMVEPTNSTESSDKREITVQEYDLGELKTFFFQGTIIQLTITMLISYMYNTTIPLITQIFLTPQRLWNSPLFRSYMFEEPVHRPFPTNKGLLQSFMSKTIQQKDSSKKE